MKPMALVEMRITRTRIIIIRILLAPGIKARISFAQILLVAAGNIAAEQTERSLLGWMNDHTATNFRLFQSSRIVLAGQIMRLIAVLIIILIIFIESCVFA